MIEDDEYLSYMEEWLNRPYGMFTTLKEYAHQKSSDTLKLMEQAFLEGFKTGKKRRNELNWESWNQK
jgi:hypothetical protein